MSPSELHIVKFVKTTDGSTGLTYTLELSPTVPIEVQNGDGKIAVLTKSATDYMTACFSYYDDSGELYTDIFWASNGSSLASERV